MLTFVLAGLVATANGYQDAKYERWIHLYNIIFIVGLAISFVLFIAVNYFFPARDEDEAASENVPYEEALDEFNEKR